MEEIIRDQELTHSSSPNYGILALKPELKHAALEKPCERFGRPLAKVFLLNGPEVEQ
jgi:hypothetical protein